MRGVYRGEWEINQLYMVEIAFEEVRGGGGGKTRIFRGDENKSGD